NVTSKTIAIEITVSALTSLLSASTIFLISYIVALSPSIWNHPHNNQSQFLLPFQQGQMLHLPLYRSLYLMLFGCNFPKRNSPYQPHPNTPAVFPFQSSLHKIRNFS